ncbi:IclR family transcriptional regulator [Niallia endozanthoxylica]|uniref:Glycerol operon regulatory protein n=1 Tax=Niallia endozanthoxylica TaxID=2036016 RepID=A0A5J5GYC6_9BACI|nr:IclR family transcriptional regulator [Niallia endozanthoxylica]KAA9013245.1 IclR family transcriptional regulator [Niallia endozanthoxylica]
MGSNEKSSVSSMVNALKLLNLFTMDEPEWILTDLADELDVGVSTVYRLTNTLMHEGFIVRDPVTKNFRLASSILEMGHYVITSFDICEISPPILEKLVQDTGETVHLSILEGNKSIYLQMFECSNYVNVRTHVGKKYPAHCSSTGQIILAYQSEADINRVIAQGLPLYSPKSATITDPIQFKERLALIKKRGYSFNKDEMNVGVSAIAAPVKSPSGKVDYCISIAGPNSRINANNAPTLIKYVTKAADELSEKLKCGVK